MRRVCAQSRCGMLAPLFSYLRAMECRRRVFQAWRRAARAPRNRYLASLLLWPPAVVRLAWRAWHRNGSAALQERLRRFRAVLVRRGYRLRMQRLLRCAFWHWKASRQRCHRVVIAL